MDTHSGPSAVVGCISAARGVTPCLLNFFHKHWEAKQPWNKQRVFPSRAGRPRSIDTFVLETFVSLPAGTFVLHCPRPTIRARSTRPEEFMRSHAAFNRKLANRYEQWMVILHYSVATKYLSKQSLRLFVEFLKVKLIVDVNHLDVRRFMLYLSEGGVSLICARKHLLSLRRFYDFLNLGGLVDYVAPRLVTIRQMTRQIPPHLSEEEVLRLIGPAETLREKALIEFFYATGSRLSEVRGLREQDVDRRARHARVTGKYGKTGIVLLTRSTADAPQNYIQDRKIGYVFQQDYPLQTGV